jgi:hypothetical protein
VPFKKDTGAWCWWLKPVILATPEAEISRIVIQSQPCSSGDPIVKKPITKKGLVEWLQGVGPEFKPQYCQKKKKRMVRCREGNNVMVKAKIGEYSVVCVCFEIGSH